MNLRSRTSSMVPFPVAIIKWQLAIGLWQLAIFGAASAQNTHSLAVREEAALRAAAERVAPSVVQIRTIGGLDVVEGQLVNDGPTTGLVISPDGYILSSAFNFAQQPSSILITFASGKQAPAELVATDHSRMIVLLKAAGTADLPIPELAPAADIRPGQWAVAVGRTFRPDHTNLTVGIVSAVGRMYGKAIQTDAAVSTANYGGPLADIRGRVLGIIVPMAPQATSEMAGAEWYDSGIGFAVPIEPLTKSIERMKKGVDLRAGLLGVGMKPGNPHSTPAEVAVVRPDSPAGLAGLKKGDRLIEIDGRTIRNQSDMRFALGTAYGGDSVRLVINRGNDRFEKSIELVGKLPAFRHAFLGILPLRSNMQPEQEAADTPGITVRMVYPGSPAADAGLSAGDRLLRIDDTQVESLDDALAALNNASPDSKVAVQFTHGDETKEVQIKTTQLPNSVPTELPVASQAIADSNAVVGAGETIELRLPETPHTCHVYVPGSHSIGQSLGALLWLQSPTDAKVDELVGSWQANCEREGFVLILPFPHKSDHWERTDLDYLTRVLQKVVSQYKIDPHRIVVGGKGRTGAIAWPLALANREMVRGVAAVAAPLPRGNRVPENDPTQRLAVFAAIPPSKEAAVPITLGLKRVGEAGYNITTITLAKPNFELSDAERSELARWIDTLDRL